MAIGLLATATASSTAVTLYTVPAGVSHAVVHLTVSTVAGSVTRTAVPNDFGGIVVNGNYLLTLKVGAVATSAQTGSINGYVLDGASLSVMLSPGDNLQLRPGGDGSGTIPVTGTVSGYTVS